MSAEENIPQHEQKVTFDIKDVPSGLKTTMWVVSENLKDHASRMRFYRDAQAHVRKNEQGQVLRMIGESIMLDVMAENTGIDRARLVEIFYQQTEITDDERRRLEEVMFDPEESEDYDG